MLAGVDTAGAVVSRTVTRNDAEAELPAASVAVHNTVLTLIGNVEPEAGLQTTGRLPLTLSEAAGLV